MCAGSSHADCNSNSSEKNCGDSEIIYSSSEITFHEQIMKTLSFGDKLAFLSQHVFYFHVLDDDTKKKKPSRNNPKS